MGHGPVQFVDGNMKEIQLPTWKQTALQANQHATISSFPHKLPNHAPHTTNYIFMLAICPSSLFIMSILPLVFLPLPYSCIQNKTLFS